MSSSFDLTLYNVSSVMNQEVRGVQFATGNRNIFFQKSQAKDLVDFLKKNHLNVDLRTSITNLENEIRSLKVEVTRGAGANDSRVNLQEYQTALKELLVELKALKLNSDRERVSVKIKHQSAQQEVEGTGYSGNYNIGNKSINAFIDHISEYHHFSTSITE